MLVKSIVIIILILNNLEEIKDIIQKMTDITREYPINNLTNFTLVPGIYEEGITDNNFPKIRKDVLEKLNEFFFAHQVSTIQIPTKISTEKGINLLNNSFIRKKNGKTAGSEIVMEDKFYREKLNYFKMSGKPDLNKRLNSFKEGIKGVLESITANSNKNYFFASHSHFMQALYKSICESGKTPYFDNLDILHLIVLPNKILVKGVYRWKDSYKLDIHSFLGDCNSDSTKDLKEPYLNLFMMRHCVACHNVVESLLKKGLKKMKKNYGSTSMCLKLVEDLNEETKGSRKIMGLIKMLKENTGTDKLTESINFGSSVSLRTTLTGLVVQRLIALNTTPGEPITPSTESESGGPESGPESGEDEGPALERKNSFYKRISGLLRKRKKPESKPMSKSEDPLEGYSEAQMEEIKSITNPKKWEGKEEKKKSKQILEKFNSEGFNNTQKKEILENFGNMINETLEKIENIEQQFNKQEISKQDKLNQYSIRLVILCK